jgi:hypothetical protein
MHSSLFGVVLRKTGKQDPTRLRQIASQMSLLYSLSMKRNNVLAHALPAREVARAARTEERLDTCVLHRVCHKLVHAQ